MHASSDEPGGAVLWRYRSRAAVASASPATTQSGASTTLAPGAARQPPPKAASASAASRSRSSRHLRFFVICGRRASILRARARPRVARRLFSHAENSRARPAFRQRGVPASRRVVGQLSYQVVKLQILLGVFGMRCLAKLDELDFGRALSQNGLSVRSCFNHSRQRYESEKSHCSSAFLSSGHWTSSHGALDQRTSTASPEESLRLGRFAATGRRRGETARKHGSDVPRGARRAARAPRLVRIRIKHHLLQFPLGVARRLLNNLTTNINGDGVLRARDDDGRLIRKSRHGRKAAALHDVDELPVPLVRRDGIFNILVQADDMRLPLLVDLRGDACVGVPASTPPRRDSRRFESAPATRVFFRGRRRGPRGSRAR